MFPDVPLTSRWSCGTPVLKLDPAVTVSVNACFGTKSNEIVLAVQSLSVAPRTIFTGARSSCTTITVSADCTQFISGNMLAVSVDTTRKSLPDPLMFVTSVRFL